MFQRFENIIKLHCNTVFVSAISEMSLPRSGLFSRHQMRQPQFMGGVFAFASTLAVLIFQRDVGSGKSKVLRYNPKTLTYKTCSQRSILHIRMRNCNLYLRACDKRDAFPLKRTKDAEPWRCRILRAELDRYDVDPLMPHENA